MSVEQHGGTVKHYGCELGDVHFAIHPMENFDDAPAGVGSTRLAFTVFDMAAFVARVRSHRVALAYEPRDTGFAVMTALTDPDGNHVEFTQLSDGWFEHLQERRAQGHDVIARWKNARPRPAASSGEPPE
jgi:hypothetical protein